MSNRRGKIATAVALVVLGVAGMSMWSGVGMRDARADAAFYSIDEAQAMGAPGSIIRLEPMNGAPLGASAAISGNRAPLTSNSSSGR